MRCFSVRAFVWRSSWLPVALVMLSSCPAWALDSVDTVLQRGAAACARGAIQECIDTYESFADEGGVSADVSFNRGLAYLARYRSSHAEPGDLGRAAAGFDECLWLRDGRDREAREALTLVRAEVARRLARAGSRDDVSASPGVGVALASLLDERVWGGLSLLSSVLIAAALLARRHEHPRWRLTGYMGLALGGVALSICGLFTAIDRYERLHVGAGVILQENSRILDDQGHAQTGASLPEASEVEVLGRHGTLVRIRFGSREGYLSSSALKVVRWPPQPLN